MEEEKKLIDPIPEEDFKKQIHEAAVANYQKVISDFAKHGILSLRSYMCVSKFKSVRRAIRRQRVSIFGDIYPKRPFNNRKQTDRQSDTYKKRRIYEQFKHKNKVMC